MLLNLVHQWMIQDSLSEPAYMLSIVNENLIEGAEIRVLGLALLLGIIYYSINWTCGTLYDNGYDIFGLLKKKKKSRRRS